MTPERHPLPAPLLFQGVTLKYFRRSLYPQCTQAVGLSFSVLFPLLTERGLAEEEALLFPPQLHSQSANTNKSDASVSLSPICTV